MPWREEAHHAAQLAILSFASVAADIQRRAPVVVYASRRELAAIVIKRALGAAIVVRASEYLGCAAINFTRHRSMTAVDRIEWAASSLVATSVAAAGVLGVQRAGGRPLLGVGFLIMPAFYSALATRESLVIMRNTQLQRYEATIFAATSTLPVFALLPASLRYLILPPLVCPPFCAAWLSEKVDVATKTDAPALVGPAVPIERGRTIDGPGTGAAGATAEQVAVGKEDAVGMEMAAERKQPAMYIQGDAAADDADGPGDTRGIEAKAPVRLPAETMRFEASRSPEPTSVTTDMHAVTLLFAQVAHQHGADADPGECWPRVSRGALDSCPAAHSCAGSPPDLGPITTFSGAHAPKGPSTPSQEQSVTTTLGAQMASAENGTPELSAPPTVFASASTSASGGERGEPHSGHASMAVLGQRQTDAGRVGGEQRASALRACLAYAYDARDTAGERRRQAFDPIWQLVAETIVASARAGGWTSALEAMQLSDVAGGRYDADDSVHAPPGRPARDHGTSHHVYDEVTHAAPVQRSRTLDCVQPYDDPTSMVYDRDSALLPDAASRTERATAALELCIRHPPAHLSSAMLPIFLDDAGPVNGLPSADCDRTYRSGMRMLRVAGTQEQPLSESITADVAAGLFARWKRRLLEAGSLTSRWFGTGTDGSIVSCDGDGRQSSASMPLPPELSRAIEVEEACLALPSTLLTASPIRSRGARQAALARLSYVAAMVAPVLEARTAPAPLLFGSARSDEATSNLRVAIQLGLLPPSPTGAGDGDDIVEGLEPVIGLKADAIYWTSHYSWFRWFASGCEAPTPAPVRAHASASLLQRSKCIV